MRWMVTLGRQSGRQPLTAAHGKGKSTVGAMSAEGFVKDAAIGGMVEVALGQLPSTKATDQKRQRFRTGHGRRP